MKAGLSIQDLAREIQRVEDSKKDFIAPTQQLWTEVTADKQIQLKVEGNGAYNINEVAHNQLGDRLGIPRKYYQRMQATAPDLLTTNINAWFRKEPENRMIRTLDGNVRAVLSDRYRPLDNYIIAHAALPVLCETAQQGNLTIKSSQITDRRLYIQCTFPKIQGEVKAGDVIQAGIAISNSEVGLGAFNVEMLIYRLVCSNGMIREQSMKKYHVGKRIDTGEEITSDFYRLETRQADDKAFMMKIEDTIRHSFNPQAFQIELTRLQKASNNTIPVTAVDSTIQEVTKRYNMSDSDSNSILGYLIADGDLSQWGIANAVTRMAHDTEDYDKGFEYERVGGKIIDLSSSEWSVITKQ